MIWARFSSNDGDQVGDGDQSKEVGIESMGKLGSGVGAHDDQISGDSAFVKGEDQPSVENRLSTSNASAGIASAAGYSGLAWTLVKESSNGYSNCQMSSSGLTSAVGVVGKLASEPEDASEIV